MEGELQAQHQQQQNEQEQEGEPQEQEQQPGLVHPAYLTYNEAESRFYCPFPGCTRSFAELWRLKVHYRAPPDIRGSGKERGHGTELMHCPKCGQTLKPGKHHVGCVVGKASRTPSSKRKGGSGEGAADAGELEGLPKKSKKKSGGSKSKGAAAAAAAAEAQASSSNNHPHSLTALQGDWGTLDLPPPDSNSLLMPLPPPALWPELAAPQAQASLPPSYSNGQDQEQQQQQQQHSFAWPGAAAAPNAMPFPFTLPPLPPQHNGHSSHLDPAWAAWSQYHQQLQQQQLSSPFPLNPQLLTSPADLQLHQFAQQQQQQQQQQQLPHHLHPSLAHAPHDSSHTALHRHPTHHTAAHHGSHSKSSLHMPPPARHSAHSVQEGLHPAGSLASSLPSLGSLPSELTPDTLGADVDSHSTATLGAPTTQHTHGAHHTAALAHAGPWGVPHPHAAKEHTQAHGGVESMPSLAAGMGGGGLAMGGGMSAIAHSAPVAAECGSSHTHTLPSVSTATAADDMLQEVDGDLLRVPSPPPLPHDFHPGVPKPMFNFSQFQQRMPPQQMHTGGMPTQGLGDLETSELAELNVVYDCTDDGELMQLLFGIGGDVPSMATVHMHKGPSSPHLAFDDDDAAGLFMKPKSMQNMPLHGGQLLPRRPSTPMLSSPLHPPSHAQQPPLKREPSQTLQEQQQQQQQQQQLLQHPHTLPSTPFPPPPSSTGVVPHGMLHTQPPTPQQQQHLQQHHFLHHDPQHQQPWQPPTPNHHSWLAPPPLPPTHASTHQQHAHLALHPYPPAQLYHTLPTHSTQQQQPLQQQPHKHQHQLQQPAQPQPQHSTGVACPSATLCGQAELVRQHRAPHPSPALAGLGPFANDGAVDPSDNLSMLPPSGGEGCELGA